jgi:hypothetical protein
MNGAVFDCSNLVTEWTLAIERLRQKVTGR